MKKLYDWNVTISIQIQNNNKHITLICSVHTTIHQIKLEICKKLNLLIFDTDIDLFGGTERWRPMKPTSTLQQNGIQKNCNIKGVIKRQKKNAMIDLQVKQSDTKKDSIDKSLKESCGLSLIACCSNPKCLNYQQDTIIQIGYGTFPLLSIVSSLKCEICPYRSQFLRPSMMCKGIRMSNCLYKIEGIKTDYQGIPTQVSKQYVKIKGEKDVGGKMFQNELDPNFTVIVKYL